jgi:guanylate kinase
LLHLSPAPPSRESVLLVVSGPSGSGKDSVVEGLRRAEPELVYSVSATTRIPRPREKEGVHYRFVDRATFLAMEVAGGFLETREYAGNLYGTPKSFVLDTLAAGTDLVMKPEVNGAMAIQRAFPHAVLVFLTAPSPDVLRQRLERRSTESPAAIADRIIIAKSESEAISHFDYLIINEDLDLALTQLRAILAAERLKVARVYRRK